MKRVWVALGIIILLCLVLGTAAYFGLPQVIRVQVSGKVAGASILSHAAGQLTAVPLSATVRCNATAVQAAADGSYSMRVPAALSYRCTASAPPHYLSSTYTFSPFTGLNVILDFAYVSQTSCTNTQADSVIECPVLALRTGTLKGTVTYTDTGAPASGKGVKCVSADVPATEDARELQGYNAPIGAGGAYTIASVPVGRYTCVAGDDYTAHVIEVGATATSQLSFHICRAPCATVIPHGGPVIHKMTAYLIYWLPGGSVYDSFSSPETFEALTTRYMRSVGGTRFYGVLGQYWDAQGAIQNSVSLGGTYVDTRPYGVAADRTDPLLDSDIRNEVAAAMQTNHWQAGTDHVFFVLTAYGAELCHDNTSSNCSFPTRGSGNNIICGYHDNVAGAKTPVVYAEIIDSEGCVGGLYDQPTFGPNADRIADFQIMTLDHEQVETASDPLGNGWYSDQGDLGEIADLCVPGDQLPPTTTLAGGQVFLLQPTWSNSADECVFSD